MSEVLVKGILDFWFGPLDSQGLAQKSKVKQWFAKDDAFDNTIRSQFGNLMELAPMGAYDLWSKNPEGRVALIVLLDQFPRNLFRSQARAFYCDEKAQVLCLQAVAAHEHLTLPLSYAYFVLMPLMHAEKLELQDLGVKLWGELAEREKGDGKDLMLGAVSYMIKHRDIIAQFGRFPHRNAALGRSSTAAELEFLANGGPTF